MSTVIHERGFRARDRIVIFVGPSFPRADVLKIVPSAEIRPPIRRGDMARIDAPALVAIIDGVFDAELAVTPREIRNAIARGVRVAGSSSMGALRAAEIPEMVGVGRIYQMYRDGTLQRDDEVAVLLDAEGGESLTEPLVNIRFAVNALVQSGALEQRKGNAIVEAASTLHFHDRVYKQILCKAGLAELSDAEHLVLALRSIDLKREDAQTLLEGLADFGSDVRWSKITTAAEDDENDGPAASVHGQSAPKARDTLLVWEFGEPIPWAKLFVFLAVTGKLQVHGRRVLARTGIDLYGSSDLALAPKPATVQEVFGELMRDWGWSSHEEVHVTLSDLGVEFDDLQAQLRDERNLRKKLLALSASREYAFMQALKLDLLMTDLALKREVMRLGALRVLARIGQDAPGRRNRPLTGADIEDAKRAILCERPEFTWQGIVEEAGMADADVQPVIELVAYARRVGVGLLDAIEGGPAAEGRAGVSVATLPLAPRATGSLSRSISDGEAVALARKLGAVMGVTRVAQLGELEHFGLHVTAAYRASPWSSTLGSGKSESFEGAVTGALMEELEKYCQERFEPETVTYGPFVRLGFDHAVDPLQCALPFDSSYAAELPLAWSEMWELVDGGKLLVPAALLSVHRVRNDILHSPRRGRKIFSSNGLASGFTVTEALVHALCERIERHAVKLAEQAVSNPGIIGGANRWPFAFIDLKTGPESTQRILSAIHRAGFEARAMDITCETRVPTFSVRIFRPAPLHGIEEEYCAGYCAHPNPELALNRALLEAVQTCVGAISGAREDFGLRARSLGRHERPKPLSRGDAYWIRPYVPKKPLSDIAGLVAKNAREDLDFIVRRLTAAGFERVLYCDLSRSEVAPGRVVRAIIPGMEDVNPFHTGLRARTLMVQDLMRHHEW